MRVLLCCLFVAVLFANPPPVRADSANSAGQLLSDYLDKLNEIGRSVIYSSDFVTEGMRIEQEPPSHPTLAELQELIRPFGLTATEGPASSILIVRLPRDAAGESSGPVDQADTPIPEIVVTSSLHRLRYSHPNAHSYMERADVTRIPTTADEAVRLTNRLPGTANGGISARNHVRGGEANEVLFLFDGLRLYEPYHLKDFQATSTIINAGAIGGIDFYSGAYPVPYGDRMSGVLSIELREPERSAEIELALSFFNASMLSLGTFGSADQGDWLISARRGILDVVANVVDPEFGSPVYQDYLAHVGWEFGPGSHVSANILVSDDKLKLDDLDRGERAGAAYSNQVAWLRWRAEWGDSLTSDSILAVSDITDRRSGILMLPGIVSGSLDEAKDFSVLEIRQDWRWVVSNTWMLDFGYNVKELDARYRFSSTRSVEQPFDTALDAEPSTIRDFDLAPSGKQYAAYSEVRWRPGDQWTFDIGIRWDQQDYTTARDDKQYSPRASILFQPTPDTEARLGWGLYSQAQEINELQVSDGVANFFPAQRAEHFVLNLRHQLDAEHEVDFSVYRKSFRQLQPRFENSFNTLTLLPEVQFDRVAVNPTGAEAIGAELTLSRGTAAEDLLWWLGYAWSEIEDETAGGNVPRSWDQTHTFKGGISWRWGRWDMSAAGEVHTGWPRTTLTGQLVPQPNGTETLSVEVSNRNASRYATFHTLDLRVSRDFDVRRGDLTAFLEVTNLYNRPNPCCIEYAVRQDGSLAGREKHWLPLVPSLGIVWRF